MCVCPYVCMSVSSPALLTWVIFIVPIPTLPARWAGVDDLSKQTSEQQHVHRRGLFTQTCRRPLSCSDISPFFFLFIISYPAWTKLCLSFTARGFSCISNCQGRHTNPRQQWRDEKRCRCPKVPPLFGRCTFYRPRLSVRATGVPSSSVQRPWCRMNHGVMRMDHRVHAALHGWKMSHTFWAQVFIPAASISRLIFQPSASLTLKEQLGVRRQPLSPITVQQDCCDEEPGAGDRSTSC